VTPGGAVSGAGVAVVLRLSALDLRPIDSAVPSARLRRHAVEAAAGAEPFPVRLRLSAWADGQAAIRGVQVEVWDASGRMPERRAGQQPDDTGGRAW
jgi:hypothetical protein